MFHVEHFLGYTVTGNLNMKIKFLQILAWLAAIVLIGLSGTLNWSLIRSAYILREDRLVELSNNYEETGDLSYILMTAILDPSRGNLVEVNSILLDGGEYQVAEILNIFSKDEHFNILAAEAAIFNFDYQAADKYLQKVPDGQSKQELINFYNILKENNTIPVLSTPVTNAGKLVFMVANKDFTLYDINNNLGDSITEINKNYQGRTENILLQAQNLANLGFDTLALMLLDENPITCNRDYYDIKSSILYDLSDTEGAIKVIEEGLDCDPTNVRYISKAIEYYQFSGDSSKAEFYRQRLGYLNRIGE